MTIPTYRTDPPDPNQGHGKYELRDFGLTAEKANAAVGDYYQRFLAIEKRATFGNQ